MILNKKRRSSHVVVRLPEDLRASLEIQQLETGAKSLTPVVQQKLLARVMSGRRPKVCHRNPLSSPTQSLFLRADLVQLIRTWAGEGGGSIGDMVFTILVEDHEAQAYAKPAAKLAAIKAPAPSAKVGPDGLGRV